MSGDVKGRRWKIKLNTDTETFHLFAKCIVFQYVAIPVSRLIDKIYENRNSLWKNNLTVTEK